MSSCFYEAATTYKDSVITPFNINRVWRFNIQKASVYIRTKYAYSIMLGQIPYSSWYLEDILVADWSIFQWVCTGRHSCKLRRCALEESHTGYILIINVRRSLLDMVLTESLQISERQIDYNFILHHFSMNGHSHFNASASSCIAIMCFKEVKYSTNDKSHSLKQAISFCRAKAWSMSFQTSTQ